MAERCLKQGRKGSVQIDIARMGVYNIDESPGISDPALPEFPIKVGNRWIQESGADDTLKTENAIQQIG